MANPIISYIECGLNLFIFCVGVPGNLLIIYFFLYKLWKNKKLNTYNFLISHLAMADLIVCVLRMVTELPRWFNFDQVINDNICYLKSVTFIASDASLFILCLMSYDRFVKITKPLQQSITGKVS